MHKIVEAEMRLSGKDAGIGKVLDAIAGKFRKVAADADSITKKSGALGWGDKFSRELDKLKLAPREIDAVRRAWEALGNSQRGMRASYALDNLDRWKTRTIANLREVTRERDRIAARAERRHMLGREVYAIGAGYGAQRAVRAAAEKTGELERESAREVLAGMSPAEQTEARAKAGELSQKYPSIGQVAVLEHIRALRGRFGDFHHALERVEDLVQAEVVLKTQTGGKDSAHDLERLVLGLESLGAGADPEKFRQYLGAFVKAKSLFPDLRGEDFRQYLQTSKAAKYGLSDDYLKYVVPTMMQHEGSSQFGTMQATAFSALVGARTTPRSAEKLFELGLIAPEHIRRNSKGKIIGFDEVRGEKLFVSNPYEWANKVLEPALSAKGISLGANKEDFVATITKAFSARNAGEFFTSLLVNKGVIEKDRHLLEAASDQTAASSLPQRDPFVALRGTVEQLYNAIQNLGSPQSERAISVLNGVAGGLGSIAEYARKNPEEAKTVGTWLGIGGGFLGGMALRAAGGAMGGILGGAVAGTGWGLLGMALGGLYMVGEEQRKKILDDFNNGRINGVAPKDGPFWDREFSVDNVSRMLGMGPVKSPIPAWSPQAPTNPVGQRWDAMSGNVELQTKITVEPSPDFMVKVDQRIDNRVQNMRVNGAPATGTSGSTGVAMPETGVTVP